MTILSPEETQNDQEIVREINEEFTLFDPRIRMDKQDWPEMGIAELFCKPFFLNLDGKKIPFTVSADRMSADKSESFTPFHPENGYTLDQRDFWPDLLTAKLQDLAGEKLDLSKDPLMLYIGTESKLLNKYKVNIFTGDEIMKAYEFDQATYDVLNKLHLQLFFPGSGPDLLPDEEGYRASSAFEARASSLDMGRIWFPSFYPLDTGPLPRAGSIRYEGLYIRVPGDLENLRKIKAKFVLRTGLPSLGKSSG